MPIEGENSVRPLSEHEQRFVLWVFQALGWKWTQTAGVVELTIPESERYSFDRAEACFFLAGPETSSSSVPVQEDAPQRDLERLTMNSPPVTWLRERLRFEPILHAAPADQPTSVHEISNQLFAAYRIENGTVRLGGCALESRPVVRLSRWLANGGSSDCLRQCYVTPQGERLDERLERDLGLDRLEVKTDHPKLSDAEIALWRAAAIESFPSSEADQGIDELVVTTLIWCTHASGKLEFEVAGTTDSVAFSAWARPLREGSQSPPPFHCRHTSDSSFDVAGTDDGRISTKAMIACCEVSGRRVLLSELKACSVTGKQVEMELLADCPVSGGPLLRTELVPCLTCQQEVSPKVVRDGRCEACRSLRRVSKDDPRMARILGEYPKLDRWRSWRMNETARVYIACASSVFRRLLFVVDKENLRLLRIAVGHRFTRRWVDAPAADQEEYS